MEYLPWLIISLFLLAFFSGLKTAFIYSNKMSLEILKKQNRLSSKIINLFSENFTFLINTFNAGILISLVIYSYTLFYLCKNFISAPTSILILISLAAAFLLYILIAEFIVGIIFRMTGTNTLRFLSLPAFVIYILFYPLVFICQKTAKFITGIKADNISIEKVSNNNVSESEIPEDRNSVEKNDNELKMFLNALDFGNIKTKECMVPRTEIVAENHDASLEDITKRFIETGLSKVLIVDKKIDNVLGYIRSHDLFKNPKSIKEMTKKIPVVPEMMSARDLLKMLISGKKSIALVVDEFGGTAGLVSIEDVLEEIFGEIEDEYDNINLIEKELPDGSYIFSGRIEIDHINESYELNLQTSDEYETIAGFILHNYGKIPLPGEIISGITEDKSIIKILKTGETKIDLVKIIPGD